jgi:hypothetical protein
MQRVTTEPIAEYSYDGRDPRFADGRAVVALAVMGFLAAASVALAVILEIWR